jgi:hypothetical protein
LLKELMVGYKERLDGIEALKVAKDSSTMIMGA